MVEDRILNIKWKVSDVIIVYALLLLTFTTIIVSILFPIMKDFVNLPIETMPQNLIDLFTKYWYLFGIIGIIEQLLFIFVPVLWIKIRKYGTIASLGLKHNSWIKHFIIGFTFGLGFRFIVLLPRLVLTGDLIGQSRIVESTYVNTHSLLLLFITVVILGPIGESVLFTGFTFPAFAKKIGVKFGAIITALLFVIGHLFIFYERINFVALVWFFLMEIVVVCLYWKRKSLFSPIGFHMAYNFLFMVILLLGFGKQSDKTPIGTIQLLFRYSQQAEWTAATNLMYPDYLTENAMIELQKLFKLNEIKAIETELLDKNTKRARILLTLVTDDGKKIGIKPVELIFQNDGWKIVYSGSLSQSLKTENYLPEGDAYVYNNLGYIYSSVRRYYKAIDAYKEAVHIDSNYADAYRRLGRAYAEIGCYGEAMKTFKQAIRIEPTCAESYYYLAVVYAYLERYSEAIELLNETILIRSGYVEAYFIRGFIYFTINKYNEAVMDFKKTIELDGNNKYGYVGLAITYYQLEDKQNAIENYKKAIQLDKGYADVNKIDEALKIENSYMRLPLQVSKEILKEMGYYEK